MNVDGGFDRVPAAETERNGNIRELFREVKFTGLCDSLEREGGVEDNMKRWKWGG